MSTSASDYYQFDDLLTLEEQALRIKVRQCMEKEVAPITAKVLLLYLDICELGVFNTVVCPVCLHRDLLE